MSKSSSPPAAAIDSSASSSEHQRPRYLRASHDDRSLAGAPESKRARKPDSEVFDSAHFEAARRLRLSREESGLTQEELAAVSGENPKTIGLRERGQVNLGPLRLLVVLERAAKVKVIK